MKPEASVTMRERLRTDYGWTERQRQVLDLLVKGMTNRQIADVLQLSLDGIKWHVTEILSKLNAESREEAAEYWRRYNGIAPRFSRVFRGGLATGALAKVAVSGVVAAAGVTAAVVLLARGSTVLPPAEPDGAPPSPSTTPIASSPTGVAAVDAFIAAVLSGDPARVEPLIHYLPVPCAPLATQGARTGCLPGMAPGTPEISFW